MKTYQSTGYFQQVYVRLLLCFISSVVFAGSAYALTGNNIDQCYDCHGSVGDIRPIDTASASLASYRNITSGAIKGSHRTHTTNMPATLATSVCTPCHGAPPAIMDHRDGLIQMAPAVSYTKSPFFNQTSVPVLGTCATASCHANPYGAGSVTTPTWGVVSGCAACHNSTSGAAAAFDPINGAPTTGGHNLHLVGSVTCGSCHTNVAKDTNTSSVHINGMIDVNGYAAPIAKHAIGSGYAGCSSTVCHGAASPSWGASTTSNTCTKCHGTGTVTVTAANRYVVAPPTSTAGAAGTVTGTGQVSNNTKVGAHQTHLRFLNGFSNYSTIDFRCQGCHGTLPISGTHANGSSAPAFQGLATRGGMSPAWTAATFTCSNTYCHNPAGSSILNAGNVGTRTFVSWTSSSYLADTAKTETNCNRCHKSPGTVAGTILLSGASTHSTVRISDSCSGCHGHDGDSAGTIGRRHMDGIKYGGGGAGGCIGCHGYQGGSWAAAPSINAEGKGAHEKHITHLTAKRFTVTLNPLVDQYNVDTAGMGGTWSNVCGICHTGGTHMNGPVNVAIGTAYLFGTSGSPTYNGTPGQSSASIPKTCSNISCHYFTTPLWSTY